MKKIISVVITGNNNEINNMYIDRLIQTLKNIKIIVIPSFIIFSDSKWYIKEMNLLPKRLMQIQEDNILLIFNKSILDFKNIITNEDYDNIKKELQTNDIALRDKYDAVFVINNNDNEEDILSIWVGQPHLRLIMNYEQLLLDINNLLNDKHLEIERKFLIKFPDLTYLKSLKTCENVNIIQTYLNKSLEEEVRVRKRGKDNSYLYYKTIKRKIDNYKRIEIEKQITIEEYQHLLVSSKNKYQISKERYCLMYEGQYFEIDIYPFFNDVATIEIELNNEKQDIQFPKFIEVLKEISGDKNYSNYLLAKKMNNMDN